MEVAEAETRGWEQTLRILWQECNAEPLLVHRVGCIADVLQSVVLVMRFIPLPPAPHLTVADAEDRGCLPPELLFAGTAPR